MHSKSLILALAAWTSLAAAAVADTPTPVTVIVARGQRVFFEAKLPAGIALMVRDNAGTRTIASGAIKSFLPSPDGTKVAVTADTALAVYDAATGAATSGPDGDIAGWSDDSRTLYLCRREGGFMRVSSWSPPAPAVTLQTYAGVASVAMRQRETFLVEDGAAAKLITLPTGKPKRAATELIAAHPGESLAVYPAADAIYVLARDGSHSSVLRLPTHTNGAIASAVPPKITSRCRNCRSLPVLRHHRIAEIALPSEAIVAMISDPQTPGFTVTTDKDALRYTPSTGHFVSEQTIPTL